MFFHRELGQKTHTLESEARDRERLLEEKKTKTFFFSFLFPFFFFFSWKMSIRGLTVSVPWGSAGYWDFSSQPVWEVLTHVIPTWARPDGSRCHCIHHLGKWRSIHDSIDECWEGGRGKEGDFIAVSWICSLGNLEKRLFNCEDQIVNLFMNSSQVISRGRADEPFLTTSISMAHHKTCEKIHNIREITR